MSVVSYIHIAIELWGVLFCLVSLVLVILTAHFDRQGSKSLILIMLCSIALMVSDSVSRISVNGIGQTWYIVLRVSRFLSYVFGFMLMPLSAEYVSHVIYKRTKGYRIYWNKVEWVIFSIGTVLMIVNEFFPFIYTIGRDCTVMKYQYYHMTPLIVVFVGLIMTLGVAVAYMRYLTTMEKIALLLSFLLPLMGIILDIFFPDVSFVGLTAVISTIILIVSYEVSYVHHLIDKEKQMADARIRVVNMQMHPHFIFNTLSLIRHLCKHSPDEAMEAINEFSKVMRSTTNYLTSSDCISVEKELDLVKNYISIQKRRFDKGIKVEYEIQSTDFDIPPFSIQTVVENSIRYGLSNGEVEDGMITIATSSNDKEYTVTISDNGVGFDTSILDDRSDSVGLNNTRQRVSVMCGGTVDVESCSGKGTRVIMKIPATM